MLVSACLLGIEYSS